MSRGLYNYRRPAMGHARGQGTIEYVIMIAGVLMIVALTANFLLNNVLKTQTKTLGNQSDQIKGYKNQLQQQLASTVPSPTPTPTAGP